MYVLYTKNNCPYCDDAIALLKNKDESFCIINLTDQEDLLRQLKDAYEWQTAPIIFKREGKFSVLVGGFTDLREYLSGR